MPHITGGVCSQTSGQSAVIVIVFGNLANFTIAGFSGSSQGYNFVTFATRLATVCICSVLVLSLWTCGTDFVRAVASPTDFKAVGAVDQEIVAVSCLSVLRVKAQSWACRVKVVSSGEKGFADSVARYCCLCVRGAIFARSVLCGRQTAPHCALAVAVPGA